MKRTVESRTNIALKVFMASLSTAGREERAPRPGPPSRPEVMSVDRWIDGKWVTKFYTWDAGANQYAIDVSDQYRQDGSRIW